MVFNEKEYQKKWREDNSTHIKEYQKRYRKDNKKQSRAYQKEWYKKNKEDIILKHKEYYQTNKDKWKLTLLLKGLIAENNELVEIKEIKDEKLKNKLGVLANLK